jgi:hypothetical protein
MKNGSNVMIVKILFSRCINGYRIGGYMYCPRCGGRMCKGISPPTLSARENYRPWKDEEMVYIYQVINKELMPYQCAKKLDRSLASIESKVRREKKHVNKE